MPAFKAAGEPYRNDFSDLYWDAASGIAIVRGAGLPEGGVLKVWDVRGGRFLGTLGTRNAVNQPIRFIRPGTITAYAWPDGTKRLMEFDLARGERRIAEAPEEGAEPYRGGRHVEGKYGTLAERVPLPGGEAALQAEGSTMRLHLVSADDGQPLVSFVPFAGDMWIIHTADGKWCGPGEVLDHVSFYRGRELLSPQQIAELKSPEDVAAVLRRHVKRPNQNEAPRDGGAGGEQPRR